MSCGSCNDASSLYAVSSYARIQQQVDALKGSVLFKRTIKKKDRAEFEDFTLYSRGTRLVTVFNADKSNKVFRSRHILAAGTVHGSVVLGEVEVTHFEENRDGALDASFSCKVIVADGTVVSDFVFSLARRSWGSPLQNFFNQTDNATVGVSDWNEFNCIAEYCIGTDGSGPCAGGFNGWICTACLAICLIAN